MTKKQPDPRHENLTRPHHGPGTQPGPNHFRARGMTPEAVGRVIVAKIEKAQEDGNEVEVFRLLDILRRVNQIRARRLERLAA